MENIEKDKDKHISRHKELHKMLDELVADFIDLTDKMPSKTTVMELMQWSHKQTKNPTTKNRG
jgi:hypothetical protein